MSQIITHLYGTAPLINNAAFTDADDIFKKSGGNLGNLMFSYALSEIYDTENRNIQWGADLNSLSPKVDRLILPLANQLGPHVDLFELSKVFSKISIPLVGFGLGAQGPIGGINPETIPEGSWQWLRTLIEHAPTDKPNITLRGVLTRDAIRSRGLDDYCIVTGCPSNFINPSATLGREVSRRRANGLENVAVAAGNPFLPQFRTLEQSLIRLIEFSNGIYICQAPLDIIRFSLLNPGNISKQNFFIYRNYLKPHLSEDAFIEWFRKYSRTFVNVPSWLMMLRHYDVVVGTRIHGIMAGLQAGVPSLCMCIDSRTLELCQTMWIPHLNANDFREGICLDKIESTLRSWDWKRFDDTRFQLAERLKQFSDWNDLPVRAPLTEIIKNKSRSLSFYSQKIAYAGLHQASVVTIDRRYPNIFEALVKAVEIPNPRILSFGCSDGFEVHELASKYFHYGHVYGCDIDHDAIRIAKVSNIFPARVKIVESTEKNLQDAAPFDVIVAITVFCRWPEAEQLDDISKLYSFKKFSASVRDLVTMLAPNGVLCIYNSNYLVSETSTASELEVVSYPGLLPETQPVKIFTKLGTVAESQKISEILFRKR